jgi:hypothetical protein
MDKKSPDQPKLEGFSPEGYNRAKKSGQPALGRQKNFWLGILRPIRQTRRKFGKTGIGEKDVLEGGFFCCRIKKELFLKRKIGKHSFPCRFNSCLQDMLILGALTH